MLGSQSSQNSAEKCWFKAISCGLISCNQTRSFSPRQQRSTDIAQASAVHYWIFPRLWRSLYFTALHKARSLRSPAHYHTVGINSVIATMFSLKFISIVVLDATLKHAFLFLAKSHSNTAQQELKYYCTASDALCVLSENYVVKDREMTWSNFMPILGKRETNHPKNVW